MTQSLVEPSRQARRRSWLAAALYALPIAALVLSAFYYWFAIADRYIVFLYNHDMGPLYPDTSPFSRVTNSRHWMAGLVASGAVLVLYTGLNWLLGRLSRRYRPPAWPRVWAASAVPLLVGIPAITMTANQPTLPAWNAAQVTLATLLGLALALPPGEMAARHPGTLALLALDGLGLASLLLSLCALDLVPRWLAHGSTVYVVMMVVSAGLGIVWLLAMTGFRAWRRTPVPSTLTLFVAGLAVAYLFMPLVHHLLGTDGYFYISDSDNFFSRSAPVQLLTWGVSAAVALGVTRLRERVAARMAEGKSV